MKRYRLLTFSTTCYLILYGIPLIKGLISNFKLSYIKMTLLLYRLSAINLYRSALDVSNYYYLVDFNDTGMLIHPT